MHAPPPLYPMERALAERLPHLRGPQRRGLALWVLGAVLAHSACQAAVLAALLPWAPYHALRQRLREWLLDGADKAVPCAAQVEVDRCFAPLLRWVLGWWQGRELALAVDATAHREEVVALVVSVLYRGSAIPVAWAILPGNVPGPWLGPILRLLRQLRPAVPPGWTVLVLADRGLWSPRLWKRIRRLGWHPLLRIQRRTTITPDGGERRAAGALVRPGEAWIGRGALGGREDRRLTVTLIAVWTEEQKEPWVVVTDLPPARVGVGWYALRMWVELGFRALKGLGWQWQRSRRTDPARVARHWLVLAVASLWVLAHGTRVEDAHGRGLPPARLRAPPPPARGAHPPAADRPVPARRAVAVPPAPRASAALAPLVAGSRAVAAAAARARGHRSWRGELSRVRYLPLSAGRSRLGRPGPVPAGAGQLLGPAAARARRPTAVPAPRPPLATRRRGRGPSSSSCYLLRPARPLAERWGREPERPRPPLPAAREPARGARPRPPPPARRPAQRHPAALPRLSHPARGLPGASGGPDRSALTSPRHLSHFA